MTRYLRLAIGLSLLLLLTTSAPASAYSERGYLTMSDGVELQYVVERPAKEGRYPALLNYSAYAPGADPMSSSVLEARPLLDAGYALVGVNVRGSGCSGDTFDVFDPRWATDGRRVVEWIARQPWSSGAVGMHGTSLPGITQFMVAGTRPPHLRAILPNSTMGDLYRDVSFPGGIANTSFATFFVYVQNAQSKDAAQAAIAQGDQKCAANFAAHSAANPGDNVLLGQQENPFDGPFYRAHSPLRYLHKLRVPALLFNQWQDEQLPARVTREFGRLQRKRTWFVGSNGTHAFPACEDCRALALRFLDWALKGERNGFARRPHYQLWHETSAAGKRSWASSVRRWPPPVEPLRVYLRAGGLLSAWPASAEEPPESYAYPRPAPSVEPWDQAGGGVGWRQPVPPGGALTWTTAPLDRDRVLYDGSLDVWLASTATDTDLQVTLSEVRADGSDEYIQRGWLRASHRRLDRQRSTVTRPHHTDMAADAKPLEPGRPTRLRVDLFDFVEVIRKGSSLRVTLEAPVGLTGYWQLGYLRDEATNTVLHDPQHRSRLVLGVLPGQGARRPAGACGAVLSKPCRPDPYGVPPTDPAPRR